MLHCKTITCTVATFLLWEALAYPHHPHFHVPEPEFAPPGPGIGYVETGRCTQRAAEPVAWLPAPPDGLAGTSFGQT